MKDILIFGLIGAAAGAGLGVAPDNANGEYSASSRAKDDTPPQQARRKLSFSPLGHFDFEHAHLNPRLAATFDPELKANAVVYSHGEGLYVAPKEKTDFKGTKLASCEWQDRLDETGWGYLKVESNESTRDAVSDDLRFYAAGLCEGYLTNERIDQFMSVVKTSRLSYDADHNALPNIHNLYQEQVRNLVNVSSFLSQEECHDPLYREARLALQQSIGIMDGHNYKYGPIVTMFDVFMFNGDGQVTELINAYDADNYLQRQQARGDDHREGKNSFIQRQAARVVREHAPGLTRASTEDQLRQRAIEQIQELDDDAYYRMMQKARCSALVRLTDNDILFGHATFEEYKEMIRMFKYYDLPTGAAASKMMFSSYPGAISSTDDYYILDSGLAVTETTLSMITDSAFAALKDDPHTLPDYIRVLAANRNSKSAEEWMKSMHETTTGLYSSQWSVVDYNKFTPGQSLQSGTFFVMEQIPGFSHYEDKTSHLEEHGYFGSYNVPMYDQARKASFFDVATREKGDRYSYESAPRAKMFRENARNVTSFNDMRNMMRFNRYSAAASKGQKTGGLHGEDYISARGDLNPGIYRSLFGAVDAKVVGKCWVNAMRVSAVSGPEHDNESGHQAFSFKPEDAKPPGVPTSFDFVWQQISGEGMAADDMQDLSC